MDLIVCVYFRILAWSFHVVGLVYVRLPDVFEVPLVLWRPAVVPRHRSASTRSRICATAAACYSVTCGSCAVSEPPSRSSAVGRGRRRGSAAATTRTRRRHDGQRPSAGVRAAAGEAAEHAR